MTYYDADLGLVMCESELSLEIDALDWEHELPKGEPQLGDDDYVCVAPTDEFDIPF